MSLHLDSCLQSYLFLDQIEFLELLLPFQQYNEAKKVWGDLKVAKNEARKKVTALEAKNAPVAKLKEYVKTSELSFLACPDP